MSAEIPALMQNVAWMLTMMWVVSVFIVSNKKRMASLTMTKHVLLWAFVNNRVLTILKHSAPL